LTYETLNPSAKQTSQLYWTQTRLYPVPRNSTRTHAEHCGRCTQVWAFYFQIYNVKRIYQAISNKKHAVLEISGSDGDKHESSGMLRLVVRQKLTDVSEVLIVSIIRQFTHVIEAVPLKRR
jgi:hypothetical protein